MTKENPNETAVRRVPVEDDVRGNPYEDGRPPSQAWNEGNKAYYMDHHIRDNPYRQGISQYNDWRIGWAYAHFSSTGEKPPFHV